MNSRKLYWWPLYLVSPSLVWAAEPTVDSNKHQPDNNIVVTANRIAQPISSVLASMDVVTKEDIERWQVKSIDDILLRLPGVDISQTGGRGQLSALHVRGTEPRHTLVLIDGIRIARLGITGMIDYNQIPISMIERVEYIRGVRSALYGSNAIGGVINIITQSSERYRKLEASVGSDHYQLYHGGIREDIGDNTTLSIASSYEDSRGFNIQYHPAAVEDRDRDGFRSKAFWSGIEHQLTPEIQLFARGYGYSNNAEYDGRYGDERQLYNHTYDTGLLFADGPWTSQLLGSYQKYKEYNYDSHLGRYKGNTSLDEVEHRNVQWSGSYQFEHAVVSTGVDWLQERLISEDSSLSDRYQRDNTGYYLVGRTNVDQWIVEGAARADKNEQFGWYDTWQGAVGWEFIPDYRITVSYGTAFMAPTLGQLYGSERFWISSNRHLKPETSRQWEGRVEGTSGPAGWHISAYRNKITNLIGFATFFDDVGQYVNIESATIKGVEGVVTFATGGLDHRISMEYIDPRRDKDNQVLAHRSRFKAKYQLDWQLADVDFNLSYRFNGKSYDNNTSEYAKTQRRLPGYGTVDVSAEYPVTTGFTIHAKIANLFDREYESVYGYHTAGREYTLTGKYEF